MDEQSHFHPAISKSNNLSSLICQPVNPRLDLIYTFRGRLWFTFERWLMSLSCVVMLPGRRGSCSETHQPSVCVRHPAWQPFWVSVCSMLVALGWTFTPWSGPTAVGTCFFCITEHIQICRGVAEAPTSSKTQCQYLNVMDNKQVSQYIQAYLQGLCSQGKWAQARLCIGSVWSGWEVGWRFRAHARYE